MTVEAFLTGALEAALGHQRVYRMRLPAGVVLPAGTYQRIDTVRDYTHSGDSLIPTARFQVDCWAEDPDAADDDAALVRAALSGYGLDDDTYQHIEITDERELDEPDVGIYRRSLDLLITYTEAGGS